MKKYFLILSLFIVIFFDAAAQNIGIGTTTPNSTAMLDIVSTTRGFLMPRMTSSQRSSIHSPAAGLMVFDITTSSTWVYTGTAWSQISSSFGSPWITIGNNIFNTNSGSVGIGTTSPNANTILDIASTTKGITIPRMNGPQRLAIPSPVHGMMVYQNDYHIDDNQLLYPGLYIYTLIGTGDPVMGWARLARTDELSGGGGTGNWTVNGLNIYNSNAGKVGIGLTSGITEKLTLKGNALITFVNANDLTNGGNMATLKLMGAGTGSGQILFLEPDSAVGSKIFYSPTLNYLGISNGFDAAASARFYDNGNVGIGTSGTSNAVSKLQIEGGSPVNLSTNNGYLMMGTPGGLNIAMSNYEILARDNGAISPLYLQHDGGQVRIGNSGTTADNTRLHITDGFPAALGSNNGYIMLGQEGSSNLVFSNYSIQAKDNGTANDLLVQNNGGAFNVRSGNFVVANNSNVGVSVLNPTEKLHVLGNALINGNAILDDANPILQLKNNGVDKGFVQLSGNNIRIGTNGGNTGKFVVRTNGGDRLFVDSNGNVNIGSQTDAPGYIFRVGGKMICEEVRVKLQSGWPDYVFDENYKMMPLSQLADFIKQNKHLPNIPAAAEVEKNGFEIGDMQKTLVEKIEELTLYILQQQKEIDLLKTQIKSR